MTGMAVPRLHEVATSRRYRSAGAVMADTVCALGDILADCIYVSIRAHALAAPVLMPVHRAFDLTPGEQPRIAVIDAISAFTELPGKAARA